MIPYSWRRAWRILQASRKARLSANSRYLIVDLRTGRSTTRDELYALRSPGGFRATMRDLRLSEDKL